MFNKSEFLPINSVILHESSIFDVHEKQGFSSSLKKALIQAFDGDVFLKKFLFEPQSAIGLINTIKTDDFHRKWGEQARIPTSLEWTAIMLTAEVLAKENARYSDLLNNKKNGMIRKGTKVELTSSVLQYPGPVVYNFGFRGELEPAAESNLTILEKLGLPKNSLVLFSIPRGGGRRAVSRPCSSHRFEGRFGTGAHWELQQVHSDLASRVVVRKK